VETLLTGAHNLSGIAPDLAGGKMYYLAGNTPDRIIQRANLDGTGVQTLVGSPSGKRFIALDLADGKMYWTDAETDKIQRANLDGTGVEDLVTGIPGPSGIALDLAGGKMYWAENALGKIQRANLDGSGVEDLVTGVFNPNGIALDLAGGKMYWTNNQAGTIQRANLDGSDVEDLVTGLSVPQGIAVDIQVAIDTTPPEITPNVSGTLGNNGWYISDVIVSWTVTDPESGIASSTGCDPTTLTTDTTGTILTCSATNGVGLSNSASVTVKLDKTAPGITPGTPPAGSPYLPNQSVTPSFTCTDNVSGFASSSGLSTSGPNGTDCTGPGSVNTSASGPQSYGPLVATDIAGNSTTLAGVAYNVIYTIYLHGTGPNNNPPTLFLDNIAPGAATARYKDSSSINFNGGNPWKDIGTWAANPTLSTGILNTLSELHVWLGLKNSDDQGTKFDLRAEIYKNDTLVASAETYCITGVTRNPAQAKEATVSFGSFSPTPFNGTSDLLSLKIQTRIGTDGAGSFCGGHSNAVGLRLYFDAASRPSRFNAVFD
jgi:hypothetical protein